MCESDKRVAGSIGKVGPKGFLLLQMRQVKQLFFTGNCMSMM
jgi:hypothetical protein